MKRGEKGVGGECLKELKKEMGIEEEGVGVGVLLKWISKMGLAMFLWVCLLGWEALAYWEREHLPLEMGLAIFVHSFFFFGFGGVS